MADIQRFDPISKKLGAVASYLGINAENSWSDIDVNGISSNSNEINEGEIFLALPGAKTHGGAFAHIAVERGARAVITDNAGAELTSQQHIAIPVLVVPNPRSYSGYLSDWFYNSPSRSMYVAGITGTNGKTTTTYLLNQIWSYANFESGLIGTIGIRLGDEFHPGVRTTPEADALQSILSAMHERHIRSVAMEASSHALVQHRLDGVHFSAAGFTNLTQDHLDFHKDMESYYQAKRSLFNAERCEHAFINIDNEYGKRLASESTIPTSTLSLRSSKATWHFDSIEKMNLQGMGGYEVSIRGEGGVLIEGQIRLDGEFNLENCLLAVAIASHSGVDPLVIGQALGRLTGAPGRLERIDCGQSFTALVDYAHTPDAVTQILQALQVGKTGRLIGILGCGGDRDKAKRPLMGSALKENCDVAIFTSDNPRSEDPDQILKEMTANLNLDSSSQTFIDRESAIEYAVSIAKAGDVLVVLGKGHESGQEIKGVISPFSDQEVLRRKIEGGK
jgi:UDP-N-acetylmuramoyl-L-alanyl-D-glutamate--2,6-diaminopimelate ligase